MANVDDDEFIELFNDAGSEGDFEGFTLQDLEEDDARQPFQELHESNWVEGDRERPAFDFRSTGGLSDHASAELPPDAEPIDYFRLFFKQSDFEKMAEETNRYKILTVILI